VPQPFADAWTMSEKVDGWLTEGQGRALYDAAQSLPSGTAAVEIGSHHGKSAVLIAAGLPEGARLTAVDPFDDIRWGGGPEALEAFEANVAAAGVADRIDLFRGISAEASTAWEGAPVGFLWVDGAHDLESTLADFDGWMPHMVEGSLLYVHDSFCAVGTTKAILRRFLFSRHVEYLGAERTMTKFRVRPLGPMGMLRSSAGILGRLPFFARMLAIKISRRRGWSGLAQALRRYPDEPLI